MSDGRTIDYEYDEEERITKVIDSIDGTTVYTYDALGQLLTETVNGSAVNSMTYDSYGNIRTKNGTAYTYGDSVWKDKLTKVGTKTITYDAQGNPTTYLGNTLTWEKGRQLNSFGTNSYTYNANGIRTSKTVGGTKHTYTLDGTKILSEVWGSNTLIPLYDNEDSVCGIIYNNTPYYFYKNQQGDIIEITDRNAAVVARYTYDAWGKVLAVTDANGTTITSTTHIANVNPYRYRGYYYDVETKLYYLQSRYYDPEVGRFVNGDEAVFAVIASDMPGSNLFGYCRNNPVSVIDTTGHWGLSLTMLVLEFIALCATVLILTKILTSTLFKKAWKEFCVALNNGMEWMANSVFNGGRAAWDWSNRTVKAAISAITSFSKSMVLTAAMADAKIRKIVKKSSKSRYWTATLRKNYVDIGRTISYNTAVREVSQGRNVFTVTKAEAKTVAKDAYSNKKPVGPEIDKGKENVAGYYYHYHVYERRNKGHVFFLF